MVENNIYFYGKWAAMLVLSGLRLGNEWMIFYRLERYCDWTQYYSEESTDHCDACSKRSRPVSFLTLHKCHRYLISRRPIKASIVLRAYLKAHTDSFDDKSVWMLFQSISPVAGPLIFPPLFAEHLFNVTTNNSNRAGFFFILSKRFAF